MNTALNCITKKQYSKWLFTTFLVLSFFTYSGFIAQAQNVPDKPQTTLVVGYGTQWSKSINYRRSLAPIRLTNKTILAFSHLSHSHNHLIKIYFAQLSLLDIPVYTGLFHHPISQYTAEDPGILLG